MPLRSDWSERECPIPRALQVLGDPWVLIVLREVLSGANTFEAIKQGGGMGDKVLADRLRRMVDDGLLVTQPYSRGAVPRKRYRLTPAGEEALPVLHALARWGDEHAPTADPARTLAVVCRLCGRQTRGVDACTVCGGAMTASTVSWLRPGAERALPLATSVPAP